LGTKAYEMEAYAAVKEQEVVKPEAKKRRDANTESGMAITGAQPGVV
jgi:hypothetical protein